MPGICRLLPHAARGEEWLFARVNVAAQSEAGPVGRGGTALLPGVREGFRAKRASQPNRLAMTTATFAGIDL